ncbi:uncharacterized protein [Physcomitrium patens]|uniref:Uncharacterized protein n=1 Tax=Physcomitrium patens TaxID=3218 RepID=A0A2K1KPH7_PHYPA|nr:lisH domain-containing protein C1711.05-like [Physcomitrium patens]PNR55651.1 hypothetical protein PHYPA_006548 [Physcomitrium patens]|eukprot:XP_024373262.1 lisH domain-containing protein C1711.05-like [Physcomitrella patens]
MAQWLAAGVCLASAALTSRREGKKNIPLVFAGAAAAITFVYRSTPRTLWKDSRKCSKTAENTVEGNPDVDKTQAATPDEHGLKSNENETQAEVGENFWAPTDDERVEETMDVTQDKCQDSEESQSDMVSESSRHEVHSRLQLSCEDLTSTAETNEVSIQALEAHHIPTESCDSSPNISAPASDISTNSNDAVEAVHPVTTDSQSSTSDTDVHSVESGPEVSARSPESAGDTDAQKYLSKESTRTAQEERLRAYDAYLADPSLSPSLKNQVLRARKIALMRLNLE